MQILRMIIVALCTMGLGTSCDIDIDDPQKNVPQESLQMVKSKYPDTWVKWEREGFRYKAELNFGGVDVELWFSSNGQWIRTETDYKGPLPEAVKSYIDTNYSGYHIEDVDIVETPDQTFYEIELERGERDARVRIKENGTLVK